MNPPRHPFDFFFKRYFGKYARRLYERIVGEPIAP